MKVRKMNKAREWTATKKHGSERSHTSTMRMCKRRARAQ